MHILVKYASRSRPARFFEGLHNIIDMAADKVNFTVFCCLDADDRSMFEYGAWRLDLQEKLRAVDEKLPFSSQVIYDIGYSKSKIHAINRPLTDAVPEWDILVNYSDDMRFTVFGYDEIIREGFRCNGLDTFCHYPDSTAKNMLCTMSIIGAPYFQRDGWVYHPGFKSLWCDNMAQEMAKIRGCYVFMGTQIYEHYHPAYGLADWDDQYRRQQELWNEDELFYIYQKSHNFFLDDYGKYTNLA